jgi:hypothetical protein
MLAWSAAAVRISKSSGPNAPGSELSTTRTPIVWLFMRSGTSISDPLARLGR